MGVLQTLIETVLPERWAEALETESREWKLCCPCGAETSVWEAGGVRFKAAGNPRRLRYCPKCERFTMQMLYRDCGGEE